MKLFLFMKRSNTCLLQLSYFYFCIVKCEFSPIMETVVKIFNIWLSSHCVLDLVTAIHASLILCRIFILVPVNVVLRLSLDDLFFRLIVRVLPAKSQEFLQRHDLIVKFDFGLSENAISHLWVVSLLRQLFNLLSDCSDFSTVIMLRE